MLVNVWVFLFLVVAFCQVAQCFVLPLHVRITKVTPFTLKTVRIHTNILAVDQETSATKFRVSSRPSFELKAYDSRSNEVALERNLDGLKHEIRKLKSSVTTVGLIIWLGVLLEGGKIIAKERNVETAIIMCLFIFVATFPLFCFSF